MDNVQDNTHRSDRYLIGITSGNNDGVILTIMYNSKRLIVSFVPSGSPQPTLINALTNTFETASDEDDWDTIQDIEDKMQTLIYDIGTKIISQCAPLALNKSKLHDLHSILFPETFQFPSRSLQWQARAYPRANAERKNRLSW